jgi:hypothetical protein
MCARLQGQWWWGRRCRGRAEADGAGLSAGQRTLPKVLPNGIELHTGLDGPFCIQDPHICMPPPTQRSQPPTQPPTWVEHIHVALAALHIGAPRHKLGHLGPLAPVHRHGLRAGTHGRTRAG